MSKTPAVKTYSPSPALRTLISNVRLDGDIDRQSEAIRKLYFKDKRISHKLGRAFIHYLRRGQVQMAMKACRMFKIAARTRAYVHQYGSSSFTGPSDVDYHKRVIRGYLRRKYVIKWPAKRAMMMVKKRIAAVIAQLEKVRTNKIRLSRYKVRSLQQELGRLQYAVKTANAVPAGSFSFADVSRVSARTKIQILIGALTNNKKLLKKGLGSFRLLMEAQLYNREAVATIKGFLQLFPPSLQGAVLSGRDGFPILSDSYKGHQFEGGPRPEIIEQLPIVKVFKKFKKDYPQLAAALVRDLTVVLRSDLGKFRTAADFKKRFVTWRAKFLAATRSRKYIPAVKRVLMRVAVLAKTKPAASDLTALRKQFNDAIAKGELPERARQHMNDLIMVLSSRAPAKVLGQWRMQFVSAMVTPDHTAEFFARLRAYNLKNRPDSDKYLDHAQFLESTLDALTNYKGWTQTQLDGLVRKLVGVEKELGTNSLFISFDGDDSNFVDGNEFFAQVTGSSMLSHAGTNTVDGVKAYAERLRKIALKRLKDALYAKLNPITKLPVMGRDQSRAQTLIHQITDPNLSNWSQRDGLVKDLAAHLQYMEVDGMSTVMIKALGRYRKMEKAMETCNSDLSLLGRLGCYGGRTIMGAGFDYNDPRFKPMADELIAIRKKLHKRDKSALFNRYPQRAAAIAEFYRIFHGKWWPKYNAAGKRIAKGYKYYNIATGGLELVASMLIGHVVGKAVHGLVIARWGKGVVDAIKLARIARIASALETTAQTASFTLSFMGLREHTLFYNFKEGRWAIGETLLQMAVDGAMFGFNKWLTGKYMRWVSKSWAKYGLDVFKPQSLGWGHRIVLGAGQLGMTFLSFTAAEAATNMFRDGVMKQGFGAVFSPSAWLNAAGKSITWERMTRRAIFTAAFAAGQYMARPFMNASIRSRLESGAYREYYTNVRKAMNNVMKGMEGNSEQVLKALARLELEMQRYAGMLATVGMDGHAEYSRVIGAIQRARSYYRLFAPGYSVAGVRSEGGYFTYAKGNKKQLKAALHNAGATGIVNGKNGTVSANLNGQTITFTPRKLMSGRQMLKHPLKAIPYMWQNMTPGMKTAAWWIAPWGVMKAASNVDPAIALIVGGATLGAYGYHRYQTWRAAK